MLFEMKFVSYNSRPHDVAEREESSGWCYFLEKQFHDIFEECRSEAVSLHNLSVSTEANSSSFRSMFILLE